jgi:hypothetical protein
MNQSNNQSSVYVLATSRPWDEPLAARLQARLGAKVVLICNHKDLNRTYLTSLHPRYVFLPHWSHIIPEEVHGNFECVVFYMTGFGRMGSPLPKLPEVLTRPQSAHSDVPRALDADATPEKSARASCALNRSG